MTEHQRLFLVQARSNLAIFEFLRSNAHLPVCHALHCLQMATEMLGKAYLWRHGQQKNSHRALVKFLKALETNRLAQNQLEFGGQNEFWRQRIRKAKLLAEMIENLAPALTAGPNPEYPLAPGEPNDLSGRAQFRDLGDLANGKWTQFSRLYSQAVRKCRPIPIALSKVAEPATVSAITGNPGLIAIGSMQSFVAHDELPKVGPRRLRKIP